MVALNVWDRYINIEGVIDVNEAWSQDAHATLLYSYILQLC